MNATLAQVGYQQVLARLPVVFSISLPRWLSAWLRWVDVDWLRISWLFPAPECLGTFSERLLLYALLPLVLIAFVAVCCLVAAAAPGLCGQPEVSRRGAARSGLLRALPSILFLLFLFVPGVSSHIFASFACDYYDNGTLAPISYLHADPAIRCRPLLHPPPKCRLRSGLLCW